MANDRPKKKKSGRTTEAKLLITAASIAATLSGVAMFATQGTETQAQSQVDVIASAPGTAQTDDFSPFPFGNQEQQPQEQAPTIEATPTPAPYTGRTRGARGSRSQQGQSGQSAPNSLGTTRSSR